MQTARKTNIKMIEYILDKFFDEKDLERKCWIAQEPDGSWTVVDNTTGNCRTENFKTEFAARLRVEWYRESAEYIR